MKTVADYPELIAQWHPTKNYLKPEEVRRGSIKKIWWKCPVAEDHEWEASPNNRTGTIKRGCPCCASHKIVLSNCFKTTHSKLAEQWHPNKNGNLTPFIVYAYSNKKVWWKCSVDHEWQAVIANRTKGQGCPVCSESKGETVIAKTLIESNIDFQREWKDTTCRNKLPLSFDFCLKLDKIKLIEYQGQQHYKPMAFGSRKKDANQIKLKQTQENDAIKANWCKESNIPLLTIPYWDFDKIPDLVKNFMAC